MAGRQLFEIIGDLGRGLLDEMPTQARNKAIADITKSAAPASKLPKAGDKLVVRSLPARAQPTKELLDPLGYGKTKLARPVEAYTPTVTPTNRPLLPRKTISIEDLEGGYLLPLYGDRSSAAGILQRIGDMNLQRGYKLEGGFDFPLDVAGQDQQALWASGAGVLKPLWGAAKELADKTGKPVYGVSSSMAPDALDFATFTARAAGDIMQQSMTLKNAKKFDDELRKKAGMADWVGIHSPKLDEWLLKATPDQRKAFLRFADTDKAKQVFGAPPDAVAAARYAVTSATERNLPAGYSGTMIGRFDTSTGGGATRGIIDSIINPHTTYPVQGRGQYLGGLEYPVKTDQLFRDPFTKYYSPNYVRTDGQVGALDASKAIYAHKTQNAPQLVDAQLVDTIMKRNERLRQLGLAY